MHFTGVDSRNFGDGLNRLSRRVRIYTLNGPIGGRRCTEHANKKQVVTEHFRGSGQPKYSKKHGKQGGIEALVTSVSYTNLGLLWENEAETRLTSLLYALHPHRPLQHLRRPHSCRPSCPRYPYRLGHPCHLHTAPATFIAAVADSQLKADKPSTSSTGTKKAEREWTVSSNWTRLGHLGLLSLSSTDAKSAGVGYGWTQSMN